MVCQKPYYDDLKEKLWHSPINRPAVGHRPLRPKLGLIWPYLGKSWTPKNFLLKPYWYLWLHGGLHLGVIEQKCWAWKRGFYEIDQNSISNRKKLKALEGQIENVPICIKGIGKAKDFFVENLANWYLREQRMNPQNQSFGHTSNARHLSPFLEIVGGNFENTKMVL